MRLYFETNKGQRLAIDTNRQEYCTGADISGRHRFIWLDSEKDLAIIESELEFCGWSYGAAWTADSPNRAGAAGDAETGAAAGFAYCEPVTDPARKGEP